MVDSNRVYEDKLDLLSENNLKKLKKIPITAEIVENLPLSKDIYQITINSRETAKNAIPGQFISILCDDLILRRPFSIADAENDLIKVIYKIKGDGTQYLSDLKSGETVNFIGPFGNGFNVTEEKALLIGAGVGVAPLIFLSNALKRRNIPYVFMIGLQKYFDIPGIDPSKDFIVTEDNSSENTGKITEYIKKVINQHKSQKIYSCGPKPVLKYVMDVADQYGIKTELALERKFACGTGVCMGCTIQIIENNQVVNKRICKDGPVFEGRSIIW